MDGLTRVDYPDGNYVSYKYDKSNRLTKVSTAFGDTAYQYDALDRITRVVDRNGYATVYEYDANGNRTAVKYANGLTVSYEYDKLNRLICEETIDSDSNVVVKYVYTLGASGERIKVEELDRTVEYTYDELYRLTSETITKGKKVTTYTYAYDSVSNRTLKTVNGVETTYVYNELNQLISENDTTYEYDLNGNLIRVIGTANSALYAYNAENKLIKATVQNGSLVIEESYTYDYQGNRTSKTTHKSNGEFEYTKYLNDNSSLTNVLVEIDENGTAKCVYTIGADLVSQERDGKVSVYLYDGHGSVVGLANESGVVTDTYSYDAFGNLLKSKGSTKNCYRYCGEQFDSTTGLYYLRTRYMDTSTGRFISQDTYQGSSFDPDTLHKYLYANSNPVMYTDPSGYCFLLGSMVIGSYGGTAIDTRNSINGVTLYHKLKSMINAFRPAIASLGKIANSSILPIVTMVSTGTVASITFTYAIKECIIDKVSAIVKTGGCEQTSNNTVYILTEPDNPNEVRYVGRTNDVKKRFSAHANNPLKATNGKKWVPYSIFTGLTPDAARIYEQALISTYVADELKHNRDNKLGGNRINSISPEKFLDSNFLKDYNDAIKKFTELEFSFAECELICLVEGNI